MMPPEIQKFLRRTFDVYEGEGHRTSLMMLYIFLVITCLLIVKPVVNSLFLSKFGVEQLPNAFVLVAIFAAGISILYSRLLRRIALNRLIIRTLYTIILAFICFWALLYFNYQAGWVLYFFYVGVTIFAVTSASQFWILANLLFNAREAKRLFGLIGAGAIAGGIFGGYLTNFLAPVIGTENLILVCVCLLLACIPIVKTTWRQNVKDRPGRQTQQRKLVDKAHPNPFKLIKSSRHLLFLACLVGISVVVAKLVDFQFSAVATAQISNEDDLTAFFGFWFSNLNIASLLIQLFLTRRIVGIFGVGTSLFFLPMGILLGTLAIFIFPALWAAILLKICDGSLKQSINKAGMELLALPIPVEIKNHAKAFIDVFVDSLATGMGGILLILFTIGFDFSHREVSLIIFCLIAGWIYLVIQIRREYIQSFRLQIERADPETPAPSFELQNESVIGGLIKILDEDNETAIVPVLEMTRQIQNRRLIPSLKRLIHSPSSQVRMKVLQNVYAYKGSEFIPEAKQLANDENPEIVTEALHYLLKHGEGDRIALMQQYLSHDSSTIKYSALLCIARESRRNRELQNVFKIEEMVDNSIKQIPTLTDEMAIINSKVNHARIIGAANIAKLNAYLHIFIHDSSPLVAKAAIAAAAQTASLEFIPILVEHLGNSELNEDAGNALASFGPQIIDHLSAAMENPNMSEAVRFEIPRVLSLIGVQKSVDVLVRYLEQGDIQLRYRSIKALNTLRSNFPLLAFDRRRIDSKIMAESNNYMNTLRILYAQVSATKKSLQGRGGTNEDLVTEARQELQQALEERLDQNLERIFRLLGLKYPPDDIYNAYLGVQKGSPDDLRANALEFLDNLLEPSLKRIIVPLIETAILDALVEDTLEDLDIDIPTEFDCLVMLLTGGDQWLVIRTLHLISALRDDAYLQFVGELIDSTDAKVREAAELTLQEIGFLKKTTL